MIDQPEHDQFTDDEMRALLRHVITLIHNGTLPAASEQRIEAALRLRRDRSAE